MHTMLCSDITLKLVNKVRPYEKTKGDADAVFDEALEKLTAVLEKKQDPRDTLGEIHRRFQSINRYTEKKPLVGIVGEIYVRCNPFANDNLIAAIEEGGGEAWLAPMHEWILYTEYIQNFMAKKQGFKLFGSGASLVRNLWFFAIEKRYYDQVNGLLFDRHEPEIEAVINSGREYLPIEFTGEALLTVGRTAHFAKQGATMVVNAAPFGCMPGTITSSIFLEMKELLGIPIVTSFFDGTESMRNNVIEMLKMQQKEREEHFNDTQTEKARRTIR